MVEVSRLSFITLFLYFALYIGLHTFIMVLVKKFQKEYNEKPSDENKNKLKIAQVIFKWFAPVYLIFILLVLYF